MNPEADIIEASHGEVRLARVLDTGRFDLARAANAPGWLRDPFPQWAAEAQQES